MKVKHEFEVADDFQLGDCEKCPLSILLDDLEERCLVKYIDEDCPLKVVDDKLEKLIDEFNAVGSINPMSASEIEAMIKEVENKNDDD